MSPTLMLRLIIGADLALIAASVWLGMARTGDPAHYFGEGRIPTGISALQLLATALLAAGLLRLRGTHGWRALRTARLIWALVAPTRPGARLHTVSGP